MGAVHNYIAAGDNYDYAQNYAQGAFAGGILLGEQGYAQVVSAGG